MVVGSGYRLGLKAGQQGGECQRRVWGDPRGLEVKGSAGWRGVEVWRWVGGDLDRGRGVEAWEKRKMGVGMLPGLQAHAEDNREKATWGRVCGVWGCWDFGGCCGVE